MGQDYVHGVVYWKDSFGSHTSKSMMMAAEVNVPPNGWSNMYLTRIDWVQEGLIETTRFWEIDQHRKMYKPSRKRMIDDLVNDLQGSS
jgi:hypothetical protein